MSRGCVGREERRGVFMDVLLLLFCCYEGIGDVVWLGNVDVCGGVLGEEGVVRNWG